MQGCDVERGGNRCAATTLGQQAGTLHLRAAQRGASRRWRPHGLGRWGDAVTSPYMHFRCLMKCCIGALDNLSPNSALLLGTMLLSLWEEHVYSRLVNGLLWHYTVCTDIYVWLQVVLKSCQGLLPICFMAADYTDLCSVGTREQCGSTCGLLIGLIVGWAFFSFQMLWCSLDLATFQNIGC